MAVSKYKSLISRKVVDILKKSFITSEVNPCVLESLISINSNKEGDSIQLQLPYKELKLHYQDISEEHFQYLINLKNGNIIQSVSGSNDKENKPIILFNLNKDLFVKDILDDNKYFENLKNPNIDESEYKGKVVIEFSSPNIAKPFHMGHFRSTIIGNFLSNLYEHLSYNVIRLTYLGDWGTQFGLLQVGLNKMRLSNEDISKNPGEVLFNAYVSANRESNSDPSIFTEAKEIFNSMELGCNDSVLQQWKMIRQFTTEELRNTYERLNVKFDDYDWESNYPAKNASSVINLLKNKNHLINEDGKLVFRSKSGSSTTILKSDGSSLYITRDILAAMFRKSRYEFDKMIYVTDFSQQEHFVSLNEILCIIDSNWVNKISHFKYGRIRGMSTRKGEVIFLKDILDEARDIMEEKQRASPTTKGDLDENTSDILGVSAVIVNDLRQRRLRDYEFNWDTALQMKGDSGIKLQYAHCRLISLEESCNVKLPDECDPRYLQEPEAVNLVQEIARFHEVIQTSFSKQESYFIVYYLFKLCNCINKAIKFLPVKTAPALMASQRLLLFHNARIVLNRGMKILGLKPLRKM